MVKYRSQDLGKCAFLVVYDCSGVVALATSTNNFVKS